MVPQPRTGRAVEERLAARDRARRNRTMALSPAQRLAAMQRLIEASWAIVERNPAGRDHFLRRNFRARSVARLRGGAPNGA